MILNFFWSFFLFGSESSKSSLLLSVPTQVTVHSLRSVLWSLLHVAFLLCHYYCWFSGKIFHFPCYRTNQIIYFSMGTILFFWQMEFKTKPSDSPWTLHMDIPHDPTLPMGLILPMGRTLPMGPNTYCKQNHQHGLLFSPSYWCLFLSTREWWICFVIGHTWDCYAQSHKIQTKAKHGHYAMEGREHTTCWHFNPATVARSRE